MNDRAHNHYFKPSPFTHIDVYRVLQLFSVSDPCIQHAVKKLLVAGGRGAGKDIKKDVQEAIDSLVRWQEMRAEESMPVVPAPRPGEGMNAWLGDNHLPNAVGPDETVTVTTRDGTIASDKAGAFLWSHLGQAEDILSWRRGGF